MIKMKKDFEIICFGSAARDITVNSDDLPEMSQGQNFENKGIFLNFGSKVDIKELKYTTGGGGTNTAATFALQGFQTAFCGTIGADEAGLEVVREMKTLGVDLRFLKKQKDKMTNHSVIISKGKEDRIILAYRGACEFMDASMIPFEKMAAKWFYLAPLSGLMCHPDQETNMSPVEAIVGFAKEQNIKIAMNPSKQQLSMPEELFKQILKKVDILFLNKEEAAFFTKTDEETDIFKKIHEFFPGIFVMTKGGEGVTVSDQKHLYTAKPNPNRLILDTTGAGDAFASGFVAEFMRHEGDIEKAIQFGMGNSEGNLRQVGAKTGLLRQGEEFVKPKVEKSPFR